MLRSTTFQDVEAPHASATHLPPPPSSYILPPPPIGIFSFAQLSLSLSHCPSGPTRARPSIAIHEAYIFQAADRLRLICEAIALYATAHWPFPVCIAAAATCWFGRGLKRNTHISWRGRWGICWPIRHIWLGQVDRRLIDELPSMIGATPAVIEKQKHNLLPNSSVLFFWY